MDATTGSWLHCLCISVLLQNSYFINIKYLLSTYTHKYNIAYLYTLIYRQDHQMATNASGCSISCKVHKTCYARTEQKLLRANTRNPKQTHRHYSVSCHPELMPLTNKKCHVTWLSTHLVWHKGHCETNNFQRRKA